MPITNRIGRIRQMGLEELRFRLAQRLHLGLETVAWKLTRNNAQGGSAFWMSAGNNFNIALPLLRRKSAAQEIPGADTDYLNRRGDPAFYFSGTEAAAIVRVYEQSFPGRILATIEEGEKLRSRRMKIFGYPETRFAAATDWRTDVIHGMNSGLEHRSQIPYLDFSKVGDSKIIWEPNRHQHLVTLALAYRMTGDDGYAVECLAQWEHWQRKNPYLLGINWVSSLEVAFRAWSWVWMLFLLSGCDAMNGERLCEVIEALGFHTDFIAANLSTYYSPNTHLLGEGFALFVVGLLFPELRHANEHRESGRAILQNEMSRQVRGDGAHAEQSTAYHRYATDFFLTASILADRNGCAFPDPFRTGLERMVEFLMHTAWPNGSHPMIGDADGGRLLPLGPRDPNDHRGTLSTAAVYFGREDFRERAGRLAEETLWLFGSQAVSRFQELRPAQPSESSKAFRESGYVVMRSGWQADSNMAIFDAGPQGMHGCGHGHADALSVVCSSGGVSWLVDPGTFVYTASRQWRDYFRSTRAHNTLAVDGQGQAQPGDTFKWDDLCPARLDAWTSLSHLDYACGAHDGYQRLAEPVVHRRFAIFVKPDHWFLLDDLRGTGTHTLEFFFHFCPDAELHIKEQACWATAGDKRFLLQSGSNVSLAKSSGEVGEPQGWYSSDYGHRERAPVLTAKVRCSVPARFPWILWPGAPVEAGLGQVTGCASAWALESHAGTEHFLFSDASGSRMDLPTGTNADFAFLRRGPEKNLERITLFKGSWLNLDGAPAFRSSESVELFDATRTGDSLEVNMTPVRPFRLSIRKVTSVRLNGKQVNVVRSRDEIAVAEGN